MGYASPELSVCSFPFYAFNCLFEVINGLPLVFEGALITTVIIVNESVVVVISHLQYALAVYCWEVKVVVLTPLQ